jgi:flagellar biosynthesis protein
LRNYSKIKHAVALRYQQEKDRAPVVTAKGQGRVAEKIITLAKENGIPVEENTLLVHELFKLDLNQEIPSEIYEAVAILLASIQELDLKIRDNY